MRRGRFLGLEVILGKLRKCFDWFDWMEKVRKVYRRCMHRRSSPMHKDSCYWPRRVKSSTGSSTSERLHSCGEEAASSGPGERQEPRTQSPPYSKECQRIKKCPRAQQRVKLKRGTERETKIRGQPYDRISSPESENFLDHVL